MLNLSVTKTFQSLGCLVLAAARLAIWLKFSTLQLCDTLSHQNTSNLATTKDEGNDIFFGKIMLLNTHQEHFQGPQKIHEYVSIVLKLDTY